MLNDVRRERFPCYRSGLGRKPTQFKTMCRKPAYLLQTLIQFISSTMICLLSKTTPGVGGAVNMCLAYQHVTWSQASGLRCFPIRVPALSGHRQGSLSLAEESTPHALNRTTRARSLHFSPALISYYQGMT